MARDAVARFRIETPRLVIRHLAARDLAAHLATRADPLTRRYQGFQRRYGALEALQFFAWMQARDPAAGGGWFNLCVAERTDEAGGDRHAGDVAVNVTKRTATLGVTLERRAWGQGYATEALGALIAWLEGRGLAGFTAEIDARNAKSRALFARLGFAQTRTYQDGAVEVVVLGR